MDDANGKEQLQRFISGEISKCSLSQTDRFGKYSVLVKGAFEDTYEPFEGFVSAKNKVRVFQKGVAEPVDASITDGVKFKGRVQVAQVKYSDAPDKTFYFLNAVSFEEKIGDDAPAEAANPFLENPLN